MRRNHAEIASELGLDRPDRGNGVVPLTVGPLLSRHMNRFAARMGFALHSLKTGVAIPFTGAVFVRWYSNADAFQGRLPDDLLRVLGPDQSLQQGSFSVRDQFAYATTDDGDRHGFFCSFRKSFATLSITATEASKLNGPEFDDPERLFRPGFLRVL